MAIADVKLKFAGLSGRDQITGQREYVTEWYVRTDSPYDGAFNVKNAAGIPKYGEFYKTDTESDTGAFVTDRQADLAGEESGLLWIVTVTYSTSSNNGQGELNISPQPLNMSPSIEWDFHEYQEVAYYAYDDKERPIPIVNSAGDFYDPPEERDAARLILRFTRNEADYNPLKAAMYANTVNSDSWFGFPKYTVLMKPTKAKQAVEQGFLYWAVTYEFHFKFDGWFKDKWDAGLREYFTKNFIKNNPQKNIKPGYNHMKNDDESFVTEAQLLNGQGQRLIPKGGVLDLKEAQPIRNRFRVQRRMPFGPLGVFQ